MKTKSKIDILINILVYPCIFFFLWEVTVPMTLIYLEEPWGILLALKILIYNFGAMFIFIKLIELEFLQDGK